MSSVSEDIKNNTIRPVYLIYGDEAYLRDNYRNALIKALVAPGDNLNYNFFSGNRTDPDEVLSLADTLPFMAERRVIQVMDSGFFKKTDERIADYIANPSAETVLIFVESEVDKKTKENNPQIAHLFNDINFNIPNGAVVQAAIKARKN